MQDQVFIIRTTKYLERDIIAQTFSAESGKRSFLVRGGQRSKKRFGGGLLETGNLLAIEFKLGRGESKMATLNEAKIIKGYEKIRLDYDKIQMVFSLFKIVNTIEWTDMEYAKVFSLLDNTLVTIEEHDCLEKINFIFLIKILYLQGILPINTSTNQWLKLSVKDSESIIKDDEFKNYLQICQHLLKELLNRPI